MNGISKVELVVKHPQYNVKTLDYDIALLKTRTPIMFSKFALPACLPSVKPFDKSTKPRAGTQCVITGWGKVKHPGIHG